MKLYGSDTPSPQHKSPPVISGPGTRIKWLPIDLPEDIYWGFEISPEVRKYIDGRGIDHMMANAFCLVYWPATDRIIIPYYNDKGEAIFLAAHSHKGETPKYLYPKGPKPLYVPYRAAAEMYQHAVVVEGQFDAMIAFLAGYKAIAIGGCHLAAHVEQDLLDECAGRDVTVCLDGDALAQASKLVTRLLELGVYAKIAILRPGEDPASVGVERLKELIG